MFGSTIANSSHGNLPFGYTQLEFLQATGTQYFDSQLSLPAGFHFFLDFIPYTSSTLQIMGSHETSSPYYRNFGGLSSSLECYAGINETTDKRGNTLTSGVRYYYELCNMYPSFFGNINGSAISWNNTTNDGGVRSSVHFGVFGMKTPTTWMYLCNWKIYSLKIYNTIDTSNLIAWFIPAIRNYDAKPGMYDSVRKLFFVNEGSGEFIPGPSM